MVVSVRNMSTNQSANNHELNDCEKYCYEA